MSHTKINFTTTTFEKKGVDSGQDVIDISAYNDVHPVLLGLTTASGRKTVEIPLTPTDAYALIDALKLVLGRHNGELQYKR